MYNRQSPYKPVRQPSSASGQKFQTPEIQQAQAYSPVKQMRDSVQLQSKYQDLQSSLLKASSDLELARYKAEQSKDLEKKIEMVLQHNAQLLNENNSIQKQLNNRKAESDIWKTKYENSMQENLRQKAEYEMEIKKLSQLNSQYQDQLDKQQVDNYKDIETLKQDTDLKIHQVQQNLKEQHCNEIGLFEEQVRKLRELLSDRERDLSYEKTKVEQLKNESKMELVKALETKEKQNQKLAKIEVDQQNQIKELEQKLEKYSQDSIQNLQQVHQHENSILEAEIQRIKELLDLKNNEIEKLTNQTNDMQNNFNEQEESLRQEINELRNMITFNNEKFEKDSESLQKQIEEHYENEIQGLKFHSENQVESLKFEIENLKSINRNKSDEIQNQINEKLKQRQDYNEEIERLNNLIEDLTKQHEEKERDLKIKHMDNEENINVVQRGHSQVLEKKKTHIYSQEEEIQRYKELLEHKEENTNQQLEQHRIKEEKLQEDIENKQQQLLQSEQKYNNMIQEKQLQLQERMQKADEIQQELQNRIEQGDQHLLDCQKELESTRNELMKQIDQCNRLQILKEEHETKIKDLQGQISKLQTDINYLNNQHESELREQIQNINHKHSQELQSINNKNYSEQQQANNEIANLRSELGTLKIQYQLLQSKNDELQVAVDELEVHTEKLQEYEQKIACLSQDIVSTKNLYGNIVKTKARYGSPDKNQKLY